MVPADSESSLAVEIENLTHRYGARCALDGLSLSIRVGERFGILGPNGSGKTTLFRLLSTLIRPQQGRIRILGLELPAQQVQIRKRIGVMFQSPALDAQLTAVENLTCHGHLYGWSGSMLQDRIEQLLDAFDLAGRAHERVGRFSGGMQRRLEIAKALLHRPELLLLDEPSTGLDPSARIDFRRMLDEVQRQGVTVLLTTHLLDEADRCNRLAVLDHGRLLTCQSPQVLKQQVGRRIINIQSDRPELLVRLLQDRFGLGSTVVDHQVRLELPDTQGPVDEILNIGGDLVQAVSIGRPTLEDVFIRLTGRSFDGHAGSGKQAPSVMSPG